MAYYKKDLTDQQDRQESLFFKRLSSHGVYGVDYVIDRETGTANRLVSLRFLTEVTGLKKGQITKLIGQGKFPRGIVIRGRRTVWPEMEIFNWVNARKTELENI